MPYADAIFQDRPRAAGLLLQPVSLGHALLLQRLSNPFASLTPKDYTAGDCAIALSILTRPWPVARRFVDSSWAPLVIWWTGRRILTRLRLISAGLAISSHMSAAWQGPRIWIKDSGEPASDPLMVILQTLTVRMGKSQADALALPLRQALWDVCGYWAAEGAMELVSDADEALILATLAERQAHPATN